MAELAGGSVTRQEQGDGTFGVSDGGDRGLAAGSGAANSGGFSDNPGGSYTAARPLLGDVFLKRGAIERDDLAEALRLHRSWGSRLGEVLIGTGQLTALSFFKGLSAQRGVPFVNLMSEPPAPALLDPADLDFYIAHQCLPWRMRDGDPVYVSTDTGPAARALAEKTGRAPTVLITSKFDILWTLQHIFRDTLTDRARWGLAQREPESSAHIRLIPEQWLCLVSLMMLVAIGLIVTPQPVLYALNILFGFCFLLVAALRFASIFIGLSKPPHRAAVREPPNVAVKDLPVYTILVPLLREAAVLPILASALTQLDYPASKLDIKLILEEDDFETIAAAKVLRLRHNFEFIYVPKSKPLTKPKACNYALPFARGEFLVIFDAEDLPSRDQLRKAVAAFRKGGPELACMQAHLNFFNWNENWLTRQFAIEYAALFDLLLPALARLDMPFPLGGTSTHFRTSALRQAGAWDPFNVTEDADLGIRLAHHGYKSGVLRSTTLEEANCRTGNWIRQRSRWIKGWIQTYAVRMRHPVRLYRALGFRGFVGFQIVIGGFVLSSLIHPIFYGVIVAQVAMGGSLSGPSGSLAMLAFNGTVLIIGYSLSIFAGMVAVANRGLTSLVWQALTMPAYWLLISVGAYKGALQFIARPFYWEKTTHGLSRMTAGELAKATLRFNGRSSKIRSD